MVEDKVIKELVAKLRESLDLMHSIPNDELVDYIEAAVFDYAEEHRLKSAEMKWIVERIYHSFRGYDVLQPLIDDKSITEIMVNNHEEIFIERNGEVSQVDMKFESKQKLEDIIQAIVSKVDRVVNESSPIVDARLQDGSRVNVVLPPIALKGPVITIRKFPEKPLMIEDLIEKGALSDEVADFLEKLVRAKYNIFIGGGTGSGKTTFLNVLSNFIPKDERIITIEDSAELQIKQVPNLVSLETRNANTEGRGEINIRDLIRASLRMRPNRVIVGEVRGAEALDMLQAMNTGHDGSLSTGHANSTNDMLSRLETMVLSGASLPVQVIRQQINSAIDIMVHLSRLRDHSRKVVSISELVGIENGDIQLNPLFEFVEEGEDEEGNIIGALKPTGNKLHSDSKLRQAGIVVS
ncbi:pilus biosynthesis protein [Alkalihalobacillus alcalophilus ATCC 27647 = CGMCC 1.3604]|uniref:Pilus assembly protein n=1 Tax=Alkalihalobacillus alcalophilus ATCC 27647 = CGMCC 1.3604 TaxID=1218173 RepID=A0A094XDV1_ALKAL|nr:CpaF family protein [Alkalihalobacillus alcalophilus]KGA96965.1 pilus assembly protein [Alkalihalobacillus alcalophilus ATCC 27647 = CGMCC 1.3604]MED1561335.1 CpaF family protein [Alkalihalobacillus alcalophilus]THG89475.1 pilus biosynthesis protein [Alkalihalobacillus alcalophilus ATCC 27647 = CGMCC 1.3604]